jgi:hypothetical protein
MIVETVAISAIRACAPSPLTPLGCKIWLKTRQQELTCPLALLDSTSFRKAYMALVGEMMRRYEHVWGVA